MSFLLLLLLTGVEIRVESDEVEFGVAFMIFVEADEEAWSEAMLAPLVVRLVESDGKTRRYQCYAFTLDDITLPGGLTLRVRPALDPQEPGPPELPGPPMEVPTSSFPWWLGGLALLFALAWFLRRPRPAPPPPPVDPLKRALERLETLRAQGPGIEEEHIETAALIREYLEARFAVPAETMTTEQILDALHASGTLEELLNACDVVKFSGRRPESGVMASAGHFLGKEAP
jgi:hypothetical protein